MAACQGLGNWFNLLAGPGTIIECMIILNTLSRNGTNLNAGAGN
jgi:hypothetical protein